MDLLKLHIETLIFSAQKLIRVKEIQQALQKALEIDFNIKDIRDAINDLKDKYGHESYVFEIVEINNGFCFMTKPQYHHIVTAYLKETNKKKLSRAALETLSIIAYKQPVTRIDIESIRGVNCEYTLQKLLEKELVDIEGRSDSPGRPILYATSQKFMDYFGLKGLNDLPKLKELDQADNEIGEPAPIEENATFHESSYTEEE